MRIMLSRADVSIEEESHETYVQRKSSGFLASFYGAPPGGELLNTSVRQYRGTPADAMNALTDHLGKILGADVEWVVEK